MLFFGKMDIVTTMNVGMNMKDAFVLQIYVQIRFITELALRNWLNIAKCCGNIIIFLTPIPIMGLNQYPNNKFYNVPNR